MTFEEFIKDNKSNITNSNSGEDFVNFIKNKSSELSNTDNFSDFIKSSSTSFPTATKKSSGNYGTSQELYNLAVQSGLQKDADRILADKGEETNKIFSGGFISDIMDALNVLQYGVAGTLQGKGFVQGIKQRASFTDQDQLGKHGIPGMIGGIALDIATDPLTYIAPWTIAKKIPGVANGAKALKSAVIGEEIIRSAKTGEKITDIASAVARGEKTFETLEGGTEIGKYFSRKLKYMFGADPIYKATHEASEVSKVRGVQNIMEMNKAIVNVPKERWGDILTKGADGREMLRPLKEMEKLLSPEEFASVKTAIENLDKLGKEAVDLGWLSKETWEANRWQYIKNAYSEYELGGKSNGVFGYIKDKVVQGKARKAGLTIEKMKELGQIENPAYLLAKSQIDLLVNNENIKLFNNIADNFSNTNWVEGMAKKVLPNTPSYGKLAGKYVPEFIYDNLTEIGRTKTAGEKVVNKVVGGFKYGKVILNPATHARNVMSNMVLNWWKLGVNPITNAGDYAEAAKEIAKGAGKWIDEAKTVGYNLDTFAANELKNILTGESGSKIVNEVKGLGDKIANMYQSEENFAKLTAFINKRKAGLGIEDAWKAAESATFNYSQVTPFIRRLRESAFGFPFITFTVKATPLAIETALKHPGRISAFGKIKQGIENQSDIKTTARERASEPAWIRDGFYIKLPIKDKYGRSAYFDLTYIIPFGDLMSGNFTEGQVSRETGLKEGVVPSLARKSPFFNLVKELTSNQDFYGDKIWQDGDTSEKQLGDVMRHLMKTYMPPLVADQIPGGHVQSGQLKGQRRQKGIIQTLGVNEENAEQQRSLMEELARQVGIKIQPIDVDIQETYMETEKRKALQTLLREAGIMSEFTITTKNK